MDNLTHTAIGLFLSRIGLGRWSARGTAIVAICHDAEVRDAIADRLFPLSPAREAA